jgi:uncharacterized protein YndB with AHSA1/START domain
MPPLSLDMPRVSRQREIDASPERVWDLVSDPHHLPRWWPRALRVEDVHKADGRRSRWTTVLGTQRGRGVRADFRCTGATARKRYAWEQEIEGTPFEKVLRSAALEIRLERSGEGTLTTLIGSERLRGLSRLGSPLMRRAIRQRLDEALAGIERALT